MIQFLKNTGNLYIDSFRGLSKNIWLLSAVTFINRSGSMVFLFLTVYMTTQLNFSLVETGYVMSCAGIGSLAGAYVGGILTDKIGYYRVMFWSLILVGCMFFILMTIETLISFCVFMLVANFIGDTFRPANFVAIGAYSTNENRTRSISLIRLFINLGFTAGPAVGGIIAAYYGYKWLFVVDGVTCIIAAFMFLFLLENKAPKDDEETEVSAFTEGVLDTPIKTKQYFDSPFQDSSYLFFLVYVFLTAIVFMQLLYTLPVYLKQALTYNEDQIGYLMAMNGFVIALLEMPIIYVFEKKYNNMILAAFGAILIGLSFLVFNPLSHVTGIAVIAMLLITVGEIFNFPFSNDYALIKTNTKNRGKYMGLYTMTFSASTIIAPTLGLSIAEKFGYTQLWYLVGVISVVAAIGFYTLREPKQEEAEDVFV